MTNRDTTDDSIARSGWFSPALSGLALRRTRDYQGTFVHSSLGRVLLLSDAFGRLAEPHLPEVLRRDAQLLRDRIDFNLRDTLGVCVLSVQDVVSPPSDLDQPPYVLTPEQTRRMWDSYFARHFDDIRCEGDFWYIVQALREDTGLDAPPLV